MSERGERGTVPPDELSGLAARSRALSLDLDLRTALAGIGPVTGVFDALGDLRLRNDIEAFVRVSFLDAASEVGLLDALGGGATLDELVAHLGVVDRNLLVALLRVGAAVGLVAERAGRFHPRGSASDLVGDGGVRAALVRRDGRLPR